MKSTSILRTILVALFTLGLFGSSLPQDSSGPKRQNVKPPRNIRDPTPTPSPNPDLPWEEDTASIHALPDFIQARVSTSPSSSNLVPSSEPARATPNLEPVSSPTPIPGPVSPNDPVSAKETQVIVFSLHPNPAKDIVTVAHAPEGSQLNIYTTAGQLALSSVLATTQQQVDLTGLRPGQYLVHLSTSAGIQATRLVIL